MMDSGSASAREFTNPLSGIAAGDPFVLRHRGRFYLYGTNDGPPLPDGRVIPVFRSDDLIHWEPLGGSLIPEEPAADHWAPEVLAWNGRFYMLVSFGDVDHMGHALWVAVADRPEGPFRLEKRVSDPTERFSIDGSWLLDDDGKLYVFRCLDFVDRDDPPHGTGIVAQPMLDPLTPTGPLVTVLRAHAPWHLFEAERTMPLYGGDRFAEWTTIEGPVPVRRGCRYYCGYSGGNYTRDYGTGEAVADSPLGPYVDLRGREGPLFATTPGLVEGPGHFSVVRPDMVHDWIVLHGRTPGEPVRRVWLCPASWGPEGVGIGPLTNRPQPSPPLPTETSWFADSGPVGWTLEAGKWEHLRGEGLRLEADGDAALCWRNELRLEGDWVLEFSLRFPAEGPGRAGLLLRGECELFVSIPSSPDRAAIFVGSNRWSIESPLPILGDEPFDVLGFHTITIRSLGGAAEIRIDGVVMASGLPSSQFPARVGLWSDASAIFDAVAITGIPQ